MLTAAYINDHVKYIGNLSPEFGKALAKLILEKAADNVGDHPNSETITIPLEIKISEIKALSCIDVSVNGVHVGHIGV
ncbi:hypothetical protein [Pseudomonas lini]